MDIVQLKKKYHETKDKDISNQIRDYYQQYPATISENVLLEYATGVGKSKAAMECVQGNALIIHHRILHKKNWEEDIIKWGYDFSRDYITYSSLLRKKITKQYDTIIVDECHHVTDKTLKVLKLLKPRKWVFLSATVTFDKKKLLKEIAQFSTIKVSLSDAISYGILPEPNIYIVNCHLDHKNRTYEYIIKPNLKDEGVIVADFTNYKRYLMQKAMIVVHCTQYEYLIMLNDNVEYLKKNYFKTRKEYAKNAWLRAASDRKIFLAYTKSNTAKEFIKNFKDDRKIIFSADIKQSMLISDDHDLCIDSKNGNYDVVDKFNNEEVNSIYAVGVLNEGMNIKDLDYAFILSLNGNEKDNIQRLGRSFRSKKPEVFIFVVPYSRDEEYYENLKEEIGDYTTKIESYADFKRIQEENRRT